MTTTSNASDNVNIVLAYSVVDVPTQIQLSITLQASSLRIAYWFKL